MRYLTLGSVLLLGVVGCATKNTTVSSCKGNDECGSGKICSDGACKKICVSDRDCSSSQICDEELCEEGERKNLPSILSIDGNGIDDTAGLPHALHYVANQITVTGQHFDGASAELLSNAGDVVSSLESLPGNSFTIHLPTSLVAGDYAIRVVNQAGAAQTDVSILQGEPGPAGPSGPQGPPGSADLIVAVDTITVGATGDLATLSEALASLTGLLIPESMIVTINIDNGNYDHTEYIDLDHPNGERIQIIGNLTTPDAVVLNFPGAYGFVAQNGHRIGLIDGVRIVGDGTPARNGVSANHGAYIRLGANVKVIGFGHSGLAASTGGTIEAVGVTCASNAVHGFRAENGGAIIAPGSTAEDNGHAGYYAAINSTINASSATASFNSVYGFRAVFGSRIHASQAKSIGNGVGFDAAGASSIFAQGSRSEGASTFGYVANGMSYIYVLGVSATEPTVVCDNASGSFSPLASSVGNRNSWIDVDANLTDTGTGACP